MKSQARRGINEFWRLGAWGGTAILALVVAIGATQTDIGRRSLHIAAAQPGPPTQAPVMVSPPAPVDDSKTRALEKQMQHLASERVQLDARLGKIEQQLQDLTGSIEKQVSQLAAAANKNTPSPTPAPNASEKMDAVEATSPMGHLASAPAIIDPLAIGVTVIATAWPQTEMEREKSHADDKHTLASLPPLHAQPESARSSVAPPLPAGRIIAAAPEPRAPAVETLPVVKQEYGIELARGANVDDLRARWAAIKANYGPMLTGLQPIAVRDPRQGASTYELIAGPLPNLVTAHQVCARLSAAHIACRPAHFDGQSIVQR